MSVALQRKFYQPLAIAAALAFVYFTVLLKLGRYWWSDENYSHGLLVPFLIGYILWHERKRLAAAQIQPQVWLGIAGVSVSLVMLWAGVAGAELFVQRMSIVVMLASVAIYFWGFRLLPLLAVPLTLFILAIPIPQIVFNKIAFPLQLFASRCAVSAMQLFDISVLRQGNVIELMPLGAHEPKRLAVVEACSGIRSLMTLVTLAVVYAYFTGPRGRSTNSGLSPTSIADSAQDNDKLKLVGHSLRNFAVWRAMILVIAAVPIAILTNALRVSGTGVLAHYYGTRVADGFFHTFSGWVIYVAAALLLFATGWALDRFAPLGKKARERINTMDKLLVGSVNPVNHV